MMQDERFFDQTLSMIEAGEVPTALGMVLGHLHKAYMDQDRWPETKAALHRHELHAVLLEDPYSALSVAKPRGYAGDAGLIDMIYDRRLPDGTHELASELFTSSIRFQASEGVRQRRDHAEAVLAGALAAGKTICVLACGHFREADQLIGKDMSNVTVVDQDAQSLAVVRANHGAAINMHEANVFRWLRQAAGQGQKFDLIYTLGLTDYLDVRAMELLHKLMRACLAPGGNILLANFLPDHLATGWMDAIMDWQLIYRDEQELKSYAYHIGMTPHTWRDPTGCIVWCRMEDTQ